MSRHCPTCTCGLTHVEWSDRKSWVDLNDPSDIAQVVMNCSLDHSYDRTSTGIPYGFPDYLEAKLAPIVAKYLSMVEPNWRDTSVFMYDKEELKEEFRLALTEAAKIEIDQQRIAKKK